MLHSLFELVLRSSLTYILKQFCEAWEGAKHRTCGDAQARHVDVLCFTQADTDIAVQPVVHLANASDTDRAVQPVTVETDASTTTMYAAIHQKKTAFWMTVGPPKMYARIASVLHSLFHPNLSPI